MKKLITGCLLFCLAFAVLSAGCYEERLDGVQVVKYDCAIKIIDSDEHEIFSNSDSFTLSLNQEYTLYVIAQPKYAFCSYEALELRYDESDVDLELLTELEESKFGKLFRDLEYSMHGLRECSECAIEFVLGSTTRSITVSFTG